MATDAQSTNARRRSVALADAVLPGAFALALVAWVLALSRLMITDVWDETTFLNLFHFPQSAGMGLGQALHFLWTHSISFYRPLPISLYAAMVYWEAGFHALRWTNAVMVAASIGVLAWSLRRQCGLPAPRVAWFALACFSAAGTLMSAAWFANVFDASCLLGIALGLALALGRRAIWAGIALGAAFFCKEIAIIGLPFAAAILHRRVPRHEMALTLCLAFVGGCVYTAVRSTLIPLGSTHDIHGFALSQFPSAPAFLSLLWLQCTVPTHWAMVTEVAGLTLLLLVLQRLDGTTRLAVVAILCTCCVAYWGMVSVGSDDAISHFVFVARLYYVPVILILALLTTSTRGSRLIPFLIGPLLAGSVATWSHYTQLQQTYVVARDIAITLHTHVIDDPVKPLLDPRRGLTFGNYPRAAVTIDDRTGMVRKR